MKSTLSKFVYMINMIIELLTKSEFSFESYLGTTPLHYARVRLEVRRACTLRATGSRLIDWHC